MAALTADRDTPKKYSAFFFSTPVAAATVIYAGALVCRNASGFLVPAADTAGLATACGRAAQTVDNSAGAAGDLDAVVEAGIFGFDGAAGLAAAPTAALGTNVMCSDDQTVNLASVTTNDIVAGQLVEYDTTTDTAWVKVGL